jgi:hypothetical protein
LRGIYVFFSDDDTSSIGLSFDIVLDVFDTVDVVFVVDPRNHSGSLSRHLDL